MKSLVLASQSPRRRDILTKFGYRFSVHPVDISEKLNETMSLDDAIAEVAEAKGQAAIKEHKLLKGQGILVLSADTLVELNGKVYSKPKNRQEGFQMLSELAGQTHCVRTGFALIDIDGEDSFRGVEKADVTFFELSDSEIEAYLDTGEYADKAGSYGIQEAGKMLVKKLEGSFENVMGLPIQRLQSIFNDRGYEFS